MTPAEAVPVATAATAVVYGMKIVKPYFDKLINPSMDQLGELFSDRVGLWKLKNKVNVGLNAISYAEKRGIEPRKLLPEEFIPLLEEASNTEDPTLADMFAKLLASQLDPATHKGVHPSFAKVMGQLSPLDARVLKLIDEKEHTNWKNDGKWGPATDKKVIEEIVKQSPDITEQEIEICVLNLVKTGLCEKQIFHIGSVTVSDLNITAYGECFLKACAEPSYWRLGLEMQPSEMHRRAANIAHSLKTERDLKKRIREELENVRVTS